MTGGERNIILSLYNIILLLYNILNVKDNKLNGLHSSAPFNTVATCQEGSGLKP